MFLSCFRKFRFIVIRREQYIFHTKAWVELVNLYESYEYMLSDIDDSEKLTVSC